MQSFRHSVSLLLACSFALAIDAVTTHAAAKPDIVLIVADNLGHGDLSCYGCPDIKTPNIDSIAAQGVRFSNFYSNGPECSPTRTALLTGRYQQRIPGLECALGTGNVGRYDDAVALEKSNNTNYLFLVVVIVWQQELLPQG